MSLTKTGMATYAVLVGGAWFVYLNQFLFPICFLYANIVIAQAKVRDRRQRIQEGARGGTWGNAERRASRYSCYPFYDELILTTSQEAENREAVGGDMVVVSHDTGGMFGFKVS